MIIQLTTAGLALLTSGPFALTSYQLGSGSNYVPDPAATALQGTVVYTGTPGPAFPVNGNVVRYSMLMDRSIGDFNYGEVGLFVGTTLVAIGVSSSLIAKHKTTTGVDGNDMRIDAFLSMVGTTYEMWLNIGDTDNKYVVSSVDLVDYLPPTQDSVANAYIVGAPGSDMLAFFAYSDRSGIWAFDQYKYSTIIDHVFTVTAASTMQVTIADATLTAQLLPREIGERIVQFTTGACYSLCRNVQSAVQDEQANTTVLQFNTPLAVVPAVGDRFIVYNRDPLATTTINLPIASTTLQGIVQVGTGLDATLAGLLSVNRTTVGGGLVYSIAGKDSSGAAITKQGDVTLSIKDITGGISTVNGQVPDATGNVAINVSYTLPVATATVLGGVKVTAGSGINIDATGQISSAISPSSIVTTINGRAPDGAGNVQVIGLIDPQDITTATDLNTLLYPGLYGFEQSAISGSTNLPTFSVAVERGSLEVVALVPTNPDSAVMQRWTQSNATAWRFVQGTTFGAWHDPASILKIATTSDLGTVKVGVGLAVDVNGLLTSDILTVAGVSPDVSGDVPVTAASVGAIPTSEKDQPGGVPSLNSDPGAGGTVVSDYTYGRIPLDQVALSALNYRGTWNAATNAFSYIDDNGVTHNGVLENAGKFVDTPQDTAVPTELPGIGVVLYTTVAGTTSIDSITSWNPGDLVLGLNGSWIKVSATASLAVKNVVLTLSIPNTVVPSSVLFYQVVGDALLINNTHTTKATCRTAPATAVALSIQVDDVEVGSITYNGSTTGVINFPADAHVAAGSVITIVSPADVSTLLGVAVYLTFSME